MHGVSDREGYTAAYIIWDIYGVYIQQAGDSLGVRAAARCGGAHQGGEGSGLEGLSYSLACSLALPMELGFSAAYFTHNKTEWKLCFSFCFADL